MIWQCHYVAIITRSQVKQAITREIFQASTTGDKLMAALTIPPAMDDDFYWKFYFFHSEERDDSKIGDEEYFKDGDFLLGGLIEQNTYFGQITSNFTEHPWNDYSDIVFDYFEDEGVAAEKTLRILTGTNDQAPNYICSRRGVVAAFIGTHSSQTSLLMARLTGLLGYIQVSYGAMDPMFNDRLQFPFFFRTVPDERSQAGAIIKILQHFGWTWVGILTSDDDNGQRESEELKEKIYSWGGCVAYLRRLQRNMAFTKDIAADILRVVKSSTVNVIIVYISADHIRDFLNIFYRIKNTEFVWIITYTYFGDFEYDETKVVLNGSLLVSLRRYIQNIHFTLSSDEIFFDENGISPGYFDIMNLVVSEGSAMTEEIIGSYNPSAPGNQTFVFNTSAFRWHHMYTKLPVSKCSDTCEPGHRKSSRDGEPSCCYDCVPCLEGEISNKTDMDNCIPCPEDQWSNDGRDRCIPRIIELLTYGDPLGAALASASIVFSVITAVVLGLFVLHRNTPVVKANNRDLSYILLMSLMFSFLCSLLFIGQPGTMTCHLRQTGFGIIFAAAVSSVLAKTITVVIAFKATKPDSKFRQFMGSRVSICVVLVSTLVQVAVCIVWLVRSPPYPDYDTKSVTGKMILLCNEGSVIAFYIVIGYIGLLSALSFLVAFLVRKVPDTYNEAQLITFSMLVFCSVWISFIPAYLSTKGKYIVAVEIFAILASSAGLLGCIFFPKCYIILLRPELNTRGHITRKNKETSK
ncbi:vomeronasal type-2 receptor 26-like [Discoglossus pictus]